MNLKKALAKLKKGVSLEGKDGVLAPLLKRLLEASLQGEMESHAVEFTWFLIPGSTNW